MQRTQSYRTHAKNVNNTTHQIPLMNATNEDINVSYANNEDHANPSNHENIKFCMPGTKPLKFILFTEIAAGN